MEITFNHSLFTELRKLWCCVITKSWILQVIYCRNLNRNDAKRWRQPDERSELYKTIYIMDQGTKTDLTNVSKSSLVFINTASGKNIVNLGKPLGKASSCHISSLVKGKTCSFESSVAKCQMSRENVTKINQPRTIKRSDSSMFLSFRL